MQQIAEYIISVSTAAFLCGILNSMMLKGTAKEVLKLVTGLFLAFCVISPVSRMKIPDLTELEADICGEAKAAVRDGENMTAEALYESISSQLEAYILDKAQAMGLDVTVQVTLRKDEGYYPETVTITGTASEAKRQQLIQEVARDMGITEEDVQWMQAS